MSAHCEADLIPGRIRMNRQGKGFLQPDDPALKEIAIPEPATSTALHEDRVLVRRDVQAKGLRPREGDENTGKVIPDSRTAPHAPGRHLATRTKVLLCDSR
jgi:exoribonuclease R